MNKITSKDCKQKIVDYCLTNKVDISKMFNPILDNQTVTKMLRTNNWKRTAKYKIDVKGYYPENSIVREFNCEPFDDQLRAYVVEHDNKIINVLVQGE